MQPCIVQPGGMRNPIGLAAAGMGCSGIRLQPGMGVGGMNAYGTPTASVAVDTTGDGRANTVVSGVDRNMDGIPDQLQGRNAYGGVGLGGMNAYGGVGSAYSPSAYQSSLPFQ